MFIFNSSEIIPYSELLNKCTSQFKIESTNITNCVLKYIENFNETPIEKDQDLIYAFTQAKQNRPKNKIKLKFYFEIRTDTANNIKSSEDSYKRQIEELKDKLIKTNEFYQRTISDLKEQIAELKEKVKFYEGKKDTNSENPSLNNSGIEEIKEMTQMLLQQMIQLNDNKTSVFCSNNNSFHKSSSDNMIATADSGVDKNIGVKGANKIETSQAEMVVKNSENRIEKVAIERKLDGKGRKIIKERNLKTKEHKENNLFKGI